MELEQMNSTITNEEIDERMKALREESFSVRFLVVKQGKNDTTPSFLVRLPNKFTDDSIDAKKFLSEKDAKNAMLKITTYSLDPQKYSVKKYHFHNSFLA